MPLLGSLVALPGDGLRCVLVMNVTAGSSCSFSQVDLVYGATSGFTGRATGGLGLPNSYYSSLHWRNYNFSIQILFWLNLLSLWRSFRAIQLVELATIVKFFPNYTTYVEANCNFPTEKKQTILLSVGNKFKDLLVSCPHQKVSEVSLSYDFLPRDQSHFSLVLDSMFNGLS